MATVAEPHETRRDAPRERRALLEAIRLSHRNGVVRLSRDAAPAPSRASSIPSPAASLPETCETRSSQPAAGPRILHAELRGRRSTPSGAPRPATEPPRVPRGVEPTLARREELRRRDEKMEALGFVARGIATDVNNLLTIIDSYDALAIEGLEPSHPVVEDLEEIHRAVVRLSALSRRLADLGRKTLIEPVAIDVGARCRALVSELRERLDEGITLTTWLDDDALALCEHGDLDRVLFALVGNARDAMPRGGQLSLRVSQQLLGQAAAASVGLRTGHYVVLEVRDTGTGMDEATRARLFEPYFSTKPFGRGAGSELADVYAIATRGGGGVEVDTRQELGTAVHIYLPRARAASTPPDAPEGSTRA
jgi:signal transduction histidine kinase